MATVPDNDATEERVGELDNLELSFGEISSVDFEYLLADPEEQVPQLINPTPVRITNDPEEECKSLGDGSFEESPRPMTDILLVGDEQGSPLDRCLNTSRDLSVDIYNNSAEESKASEEVKTAKSKSTEQSNSSKRRRKIIKLLKSTT